MDIKSSNKYTHIYIDAYKHRGTQRNKHMLKRKNNDFYSSDSLLWEDKTPQGICWKKHKNDSFSKKINSLEEKKGWHAFILCLLTSFLLGNSNKADNSVLLPLGGMSYKPWKYSNQYNKRIRAKRH